jgi:hypothetical protein
LKNPTAGEVIEAQYSGVIDRSRPVSSWLLLLLLLLHAPKTRFFLNRSYQMSPVKLNAGLNQRASIFRSLRMATSTLHVGPKTIPYLSL